jgi:hypothetical protein
VAESAALPPARFALLALSSKGLYLSPWTLIVSIDDTSILSVPRDNVLHTPFF